MSDTPNEAPSPMFDTHKKEHAFLEAISAQIEKHPLREPASFTDHELAALPAPVENFLVRARWTARSKPQNARFHWDDVAIKRAPTASWMKISCHQFNTVDAPARFAYMRAKVLGVVPFEGLDELEEGHGSLQIALASFSIGDARGPEMDASELVTFLAEAMLLPSICVQPYVAWEAIDERSSRATLTHGATTVSGTFFFNDDGLCTRFVTEDRYLSEGAGRYVRHPWTAECSQHIEMNGVLAPSHLRATWHLPSGDLEYFHGNIVGLDFDLPAFGVL